MAFYIQSNGTFPYNINNQGNKYDYTIDQNVNHNQDQGEEFIITKLLHMAKIIQQIVVKAMPTNMLKNDQDVMVWRCIRTLQGLKNNLKRSML